MRKKLILILIITLLLFTGCKKSCKDDKNTNTPSKTENEDKKDNSSNPKTGDNVIIYVAIVSMSILGLGATTKVAKKKKMS